MEVMEWTTINKSDWPRGPWDNEVDKRQWLDKATGLPCLIRRNPNMGFWCGYVGVNPGHPAYGKHYDDVDVSVHGGLSFAASCDHGDPSTSICHTTTGDDTAWWLGFDCCHGGDAAPNRPYLGIVGDVYRDQAYVSRETARLAQELERMSHAGDQGAR